MSSNYVAEYMDTQFRQSNDVQFSLDEETELLSNLQNNWNPLNVRNQTAAFYLVEQVLTHDYAQGPAIVVYYVDEDRVPYGINMPANTIDLNATIEIHSQSRSQMFLVKKEIFRILDYIRKRPISEYDVILSQNGRRNEPQQGVFFYTIDVKLKRYVKNVDATQWA